MTTFADRNALRTALDVFYKAVKPRLDQFQAERQEMDRCEASRFNVFDYIDPDENCLSGIIHDLLDPSGKHGQGRLFLDSFLHAIGVLPAESMHPPFRAKREDRTLYSASFARRIDITLEIGEFGIGIENKPFAREGKDQLKDYWVHLRRKYPQRFMLVYLSGDGSEPTSLSTTDLTKLQAANQFRSLAYRTDLHQWLEGCCRDCKADTVVWFLRDFAKYVKQNMQFELAEADEE
jgi:hypothetical protein